MTRSANLKQALHVPVACGALALLVACSTDDATGDMTSGGATNGGSSSATGGTLNTGGMTGGAGGAGKGGTASGSGGAGTGGSSAGIAGTSGGGSGRGGGSGAGGAASGAGGAGGAGSSAGGVGAGAGGAGGAASGAGGAASGAGGVGAGAGGAAGGGAAGAGGGGGAFDPCPASDPCKILPLGDSITWGISFGGGYRIKLMAHAATDMKKLTFVGYDTANPPSSSAVSALGAASSMWTPNHEGHSGWTIQQDDELVLGTSKANNDGVNYSGKKVVADLDPHIVLVHLGTNDFRGDIAGAPARLGTLIDHVVADAPNALVVVASVIVYPGGGGAVKTFNDQIPGLVKTRADAGKHVVFVDLFTALTSSDLSDGVHPNEGGYEKMAVGWYGVIKQYLH
jgi:hypothetical protein